MESAASTVTTLRTPDTSTRAQWPVRTTMLSTPLIVTVLSLQAMVRFSSTPDTLMLPPGGAVETVAAELVGADPGWVVEVGAVGVGVALVRRVGEVNGPADVLAVLGLPGGASVRETRLLATMATPATTRPTTSKPSAIHPNRMPAELFGGSP